MQMADGYYICLSSPVLLLPVAVLSACLHVLHLSNEVSISNAAVCCCCRVGAALATVQLSLLNPLVCAAYAPFTIDNIDCCYAVVMNKLRQTKEILRCGCCMRTRLLLRT
jgi:hypothetical protein